MFENFSFAQVTALIDEQIIYLQILGTAAASGFSKLVFAIWTVLARLFWPDVSDYDKRTVFITFWQIGCSEFLQLFLLRLINSSK